MQRLKAFDEAVECRDSKCSIRKIITGLINTIGGSITNATSKGQATVSLSYANEEYIALSACTEEPVFQNNMLSELNEKQFPAIIKEDNQGMMFFIKKRIFLLF